MGASGFIASKLVNAGKDSPRLSTPIVRIAIGGIALGIAVMIVSVAIVSGFQKEIRAKVIGFGAHIQITKHDDNRALSYEPLYSDEEYIDALRSMPGVKSVSPVAQKPGIIKYNDIIEGVVLKGYNQDYPIDFLKESLIKGRLPEFKDSTYSKEVIISEAHARILGLDMDSSFVMYFVQDPPKARKLTITGIYSTGLGDQEFDKRFIFGDLRAVQKLNRWNETQVGALEIDIDDFNKLDEMEETIYQFIPPELNSESITRRYPQLFSWLDLMDTNVYIIITLMLIVSVINMITSLLIMILERTLTIGLLKTMGASNGLIIRIFLRKAAVIIGSGLLIGNAIGLGFCYLQSYTGLIKLNQETYYLSEVPISLSYDLVIALNGFTFLICFVILLAPSLLITRLKPARVIRFD